MNILLRFCSASALRALLYFLDLLGFFYFTLYWKLLPHVIKNFFENIFLSLHIILSHTPLKNSNTRKHNESACWIFDFFPFFSRCFSIVPRSLWLFLNPPLLVFEITSQRESVFPAFSIPTHARWGLRALSRAPIKADHLILEFQGLCTPAYNSHPASAPATPPCFWN